MKHIQKDTKKNVNTMWYCLQKKYANWLEQQFVDITNESSAESQTEGMWDPSQSAAIERVCIDNLRNSNRKLDADIVSKLGEAANFK